jgi:hypothetical protein
MLFAYFKKAPTIKTIGNINNSGLRKWLVTEFQDKIVKKHFKQHYHRGKQKLLYMDAFYLLDNNILINLQAKGACILHDHSQDEIAEEMIQQFKRFTNREGKTQEICLIVNGTHGLTTTGLKIKKPILDLSKNYNDDLLPLHKKIVATLKQKDKSRLYLFHGIPVLVNPPTSGILFALSIKK